MNTNLTKNIVVAVQLLLLFSFGSICYGQTHFQRSVVRLDNLTNGDIEIPLPADCHDARIGVRLFYSGENNIPQSWNFLPLSVSSLTTPPARQRCIENYFC
jgi:hypothetical protein